MNGTIVGRGVPTVCVAVALGVSSLLLVLGSPLSASTQAKGHAIRVKVMVTGTELIRPTDPPPAPDASGTRPYPGTTTLKWVAQGLGKGRAEQRFDVTPKGGYEVSGTLALDAGNGSVLRGIDQANATSAPGNSEPATQVGRVAETAGSFTLTGGTGRFHGATGTLNGRFTDTTTAADPANGIQRAIEYALNGKLTLR